MQRPTGVTILAILCFIGAAFLTMGALVFMAGGALLSHVMATGPGASFFVGLGGAVIGGTLLLIGVLDLVVGIGFLKLQNWARILMIIFVGLSLLGSGGGFLFMFGHFLPLLMFRHVVSLVIDIWILIYLFQPHVKQAFGAGSF
jgi:hypothetical protein